jgi:acyl-coenzyme A thioesterase PaaI-like protein
MTDVPPLLTSIPSRLACTGRVDDGDLIITTVPRSETMHCGSLRASVLSFVADVGAGVTIDDDPEQWSFTSELSLRMVGRPATGPVEATTKVLRMGRRSATCEVRMATLDGTPQAYSLVSFARVARRPTDPVKPNRRGMAGFDGWLVGVEPLDRPLREAAGIEVIDAANGVVELTINDDLRNPSGALQGAMVALIAECAAEEIVGHRTGRPVLVTELDVRYLAQSRVGPVRSRCEPMGDAPDAPVSVELIDQTTGKLTTHVYVRAVPR